LVLPPGEVEEIYNLGSEADLTSMDYVSGSLKGYWRMNENSGDQVADASDNGNTASFVDNPTWNSDVPPVFIFGCTDSFAGNYDPDANTNDGSCSDYPDNGNFSLGFDGEDDYVDIESPQNSLMAQNNSITISSWVRIPNDQLNNYSTLIGGRSGYAYIIWAGSNFISVSRTPAYQG
jgi:hypothetical protein